MAVTFHQAHHPPLANLTGAPTTGPHTAIALNSKWQTFFFDEIRCLRATWLSFSKCGPQLSYTIPTSCRSAIALVYIKRLTQHPLETSHGRTSQSHTMGLVGLRIL